MLDLEKKYIELIKKMLARHVPDKAVWVYGSRIKGTAHAGSDLDLVVMDSSEDTTPQKQLSALRASLSESDLPILVDVLNWSDIPDAFKNEIEAVHEVLQEPQENI
jgi:uncharacterized protein